MNRITVRLPDSSGSSVDDMVRDIEENTGCPPVRGSVDDDSNTYRIEVEDEDAPDISAHIRSLGYETLR